MKKSVVSIFTLVLALNGSAQELQDSVKTQQLDEVVVETKLQNTSATVSTYIPTAKQKNASQTGTDLLNRMAIPQLSLSMGNSVQTISGKSVDIFIDYQPASEQDLSGMRMADVKKVEYYDFPEDPRFMGKPHVVNFIMQKYEYGGYLKASAHEFFIANSGQLDLYSKVQYKKMTYDLAVGGYYRNGSHDFNNTLETYRLPQPDGIINQFERYSETTYSKSLRRYIWPTFKALYSTDKISISNTIGANFDNFPKENTAGKVYFTPNEFQSTGFTSNGSHLANSITYSGYWNFILPHRNTLNFHPYYSYSHNTQHSLYTENNLSEYANDAKDNSHLAIGILRFQHDFGKWGNITIGLQSKYTNNHTKYEGTSNVSDHLTTLQIGPGVTYSYSNDKLYGMVGVGLTYDYSKLADNKEESTLPWIDFSLQYSFNNKNSINAGFHHMNGLPALSYRSSAIIQSNPLMKYTGNTALTPYHNYDFGLSYQWLPNNKFSFAAFATGYVATNRFAFVYEASSEGILRTVQQPVGNYFIGNFGINSTARLINNNLQISGQISHYTAKIGYPSNWTKSHINWAAQVFYFLNQWHFGVQYQSHIASSEGMVNGTWVSNKDAYTAIVGWGNSSWNIQCQIANPFRWNWKSGSTIMRSNNYDLIQSTYNPNNHCFVYLTATYTFGFGKKINIGNEATQQTGASSAILK